MKTVSNKTRKPIKVSLPGGRFLYLGPAKTGQISDSAAEIPSVKRLVKAGEIEIHGEAQAQVAMTGKSGPAHEATHGHTPTKIVRPKGDR